jgi:hypothetical protein
MGRFSPTVQEEAFDLGGIIDRLAGGYFGGRQQKEERRRRKRQERREDEAENRYIRQLREGDLAKPGAQSLAGFLGEAPWVDPEAPRMTPETLARVGSAAEEDVPIQFERPDPTDVQLPGGGTVKMQDRAPYMMASGAVMDPRAARQEQTLSTVLDEQSRRRFAGPEPWEPTSRKEQIDFTRDTAVAGRPPEKPREVAPPSLKMAIEGVQQLYGTPGELVGDYTYPFGQAKFREIIGGITGIEFPSVEGPTPAATPPPGEEEGQGVNLWDRLRNIVLPGQPYPKEAAVPADTTATGPVSPEGPAAPAAPAAIPALEPGKQAGEVARFAAPSPPAVSTDLTLAQRQDMAAEEWEELVDAGTDPDEATKLLREKYGLPGGQ